MVNWCYCHIGSLAQKKTDTGAHMSLRADLSAHTCLGSQTSTYISAHTVWEDINVHIQLHYNWLFWIGDCFFLQNQQLVLKLPIGNFEKLQSPIKITNWSFYHQLVISTFNSLIEITPWRKGAPTYSQAFTRQVEACKYVGAPFLPEVVVVVRFY